MILLVSFVLIGTVTSLTFAKENGVEVESKQEVALQVQQEENNNRCQERIDIMKDNGLEDAAQAMEDRDYEAIDDFMNNMTQEDYDRMIESMEESGYDSMANMMRSIDREEMIQIHNDMGGAEACHSSHGHKRWI